MNGPELTERIEWTERMIAEGAEAFLADLRDWPMGEAREAAGGVFLLAMMVAAKAVVAKCDAAKARAN